MRMLSANRSRQKKEQTDKDIRRRLSLFKLHDITFEKWITRFASTLLIMCLLAVSTGCGGSEPSAAESSSGSASKEIAKNEDSSSSGDSSDASAKETAEDADASSAEDSEDQGTLVAAKDDEGKTSGSKGSGGGYKAPEFETAKFHKDKAEGNNGILLDLSATDKGYIAVSGESDSRLKFQVIKGDETYTYDMESDGTPSVFPLQCGDGNYTFKAMENVVDSKYAEAYTTSKDVKIDDEFQPFLRPSDYSDYSKDSDCVKKAAEFAGKAKDQPEVVAAVFKYICDSVKYDKEKAKNVQSGYMPVPDETMKTGKGICFDYASLAAAMLRSQGIPTKIIFGYVAPDDLYHAWNMFYTEETGWVTVDYEIDPKKWNRLDLTFSANGADGKFVGDGSHYNDVYVY